MEKQSLLTRWRSNFLTGLVIVLPAVISFAIVKWLFGTISNITDLLLFFIPQDITHKGAGGNGPMHWYWSVIAFALAVLLLSAIGRLARNYLGKKTIEWMERVMMRIPLFNKIYGSIKQVNDAFTVGGTNSFKTVVMIEFPREGLYSIGFLTSERHSELQAKTNEQIVSVFIPTTPNPTSGFLVLVPESKVTKLEMSVAEGVKFIVSLGTIAPEYEPPSKATKCL